MKDGNFKIRVKYDGIKIIDDKCKSIDEIKKKVNQLDMKFK